jgi:hypothetical protein
MKLINRSFGFTFRDKFLQGSAFHTGQAIDICFTYEGEEFLTAQDFFNKNNLTNDERGFIQNKVNELINKK